MSRVWPTSSLVAVALFLGLVRAPAWAGEADVVVARANCDPQRVCTFSVTIKHADIGFSHYADRYEIVAPDGVILATRVLRHPHVHEQPFTRTLAGVEVPVGIERVSVRAHDSVDGYGGDMVEVEIRTVAPAPAPVLDD